MMGFNLGFEWKMTSTLELYDNKYQTRCIEIPNDWKRAIKAGKDIDLSHPNSFLPFLAWFLYLYLRKKYCLPCR